MQRKEFKNAKVYKRQPFQYYNELAFIVGNDMAEGNVAATAQETEEGHIMDEAIDLDDVRDFSIPADADSQLDEHFAQSNQSSGSVSQRISPSSSRRGKRKKASMAGSMDTICEAMNKIHEGMLKPYVVKVDEQDSECVGEKIYDALKGISGISEDSMIKAYDDFLVETKRAKGFLRMTDGERVKYIQLKYGGL